MADDESKSLVPQTDELTECDVSGAESALSAECMYKKLLAHIADFESQLTPEQEVGATFVTFGNLSIYINGIGYHGGDMIIFFGMNDKGEPIKLMQHISQTNVMLTVKQRYPKHKKPKRIGFISEDIESVGPEKISRFEDDEDDAPPGGEEEKTD